MSDQDEKRSVLSLGSKVSKISKISLSSKLSGLVRQPKFALSRSITGGSTASALDLVQGDKVETVSLVTVRELESIESPVVRDLAMGTPLEVVEIGEGRRIKIKTTKGTESEGWISSKTKLLEPLVAKLRVGDGVTRDFEVGGTHEVQSAVLVRTGENLDSEIIQELQPGTALKIVEIGVMNSRRAKISCQSCEGWISTSTKQGELLIGKCQEPGKPRRFMMGQNKVKDLLEASRAGDLEKLQAVCSTSSSILSKFTSKLNLNASDIRGKTALIYAAAFGHKAIVDFLVSKREIDVNLVDDTLKSPLHHSSKGGRAANSPVAPEDKNQADICRVLLRAGCAIEARDHNGCTALMFACANGFQLVVTEMLEWDVNLTVKDYEGNDAVRYAKNFHKREVVKLLKAKGAQCSDSEDEQDAEEMGEMGETGEMSGDADDPQKPGDEAQQEATQDEQTAQKEKKPKKIPKKKLAPKDGEEDVEEAEGKAKKKKKVKIADGTGKAKKKGGKAAMPRGSIMNTAISMHEDDNLVVEATAKEEEDELGNALRKLDTIISNICDTKVLTTAISQCEAAGATPAALEKAQEKLLELKAQERAGNALMDAMNDKDVDALKLAIPEAKAAKVPKSQITKAEQILKEEQPKEDARIAMREARGVGTAALKKAIAAAKKTGLNDDEIAEYEKFVNAAESKELAEKELEKALKTLNIEDLKGAIKIAKEAMLDADRIAHAEKVLAEEEPKVEARGKLESALEECCDEALEAAIALAKKAGLKPEEYKEAEEELEKNKKKRILLQKVKDIFASTKTDTDMKDIDSVKDAKDKLANAIKEALATGVAEQDLLESELWRKKLHNVVEDLKGAIRVFCRIRPMNSREKGMNDHMVTSQPNPMTLEVKEDKGHVHSFCFDSVFTPGTQDEIFEDCKDLVQSAVDGYNVTLFAYGQTGAGKTFTMAGVPGDLGVSPRTIGEIFRVIKTNEDRYQYTVMGSMLELYCQDLVDLLVKGNPAAAKQKLKIREQKDGTIMVEHLSAEQVTSAEELQAIVDKGMNSRAVASTAMNSESSRSHLVLMVQIISVNRETKEQLRGKILIVDLAGSERLSKSQTTGQAQKESIEINQSLTCLGNVIENLTKPKKGVKPPYRDANLTMVMKDALGGTAKTLMFVNCSPSSSNIDETLNSLKYAQRAKKVENKQDKKTDKKK